MISLNFLGGAGVGKTGTASGVFSLLKKNRVKCDLVTEYAKKVTWLKSLKVLENQLYVFAKQQMGQFIIRDQVDVGVTDSPLLLNIVYGRLNNMPKCFEELVIHTYNQYDNMNFILKRIHEYEEVGRNQTEEESIAIDQIVLDVMHEYNIPYEIVEPTLEGEQYIANKVLAQLNK